MKTSRLAEQLRRLDIGCAQRARWLGIRRIPEKTATREVEEARRSTREEVRRSLQEKDGFYRQ